MVDDTVLVLCAVTGDLTAWDALRDRASAAQCATALLALEPSPSPLALLCAFAALEGKESRCAP